MGGKIDGYFDCTSPYSYWAFLYIRKNREKLAQYGVEFEAHPIFLGGINVGSGNKPPWTLPAKAKYGDYDRVRAIKHFGTPGISAPSFFPMLSILPQRSMIFVKDRYPREEFEQAFLKLWVYVWIKHVDPSKPENLAKCLAEHFSEPEVREIMAAANTPKYKQALTDTTKMVVDSGAFGAPWFLVTNSKGMTEPFFGSDRFHYMWEFLGLDWVDISIKDKLSSSKL